MSGALIESALIGAAPEAAAAAVVVGVILSSFATLVSILLPLRWAYRLRPALALRTE